MKKGVILLLLLAVLSLPGLAFATNWVRVGNGEYFIDSETAELLDDGTRMRYWECYVEDSGCKWLRHYNVQLKGTPMRANMIKGYLYRADNQLDHEIVGPHSFGVQQDSAIKKAIDVAMNYAQEREAGNATPKLP